MLYELVSAVVPARARQAINDARRWPASLAWRTARQKKTLLESNSFSAEERKLIAIVDSRISCRDDMFLGDLAHYFNVGLSAIHCIEEAMAAARIERIATILDLPSGYGSVMRFLVRRFPEASITACELMPDAVRFCAERFHAVPVISSPQLSELQIEGTFDLIWCGSLVTHLDAGRTRELLAFFSRHLSQDGLVVFTTHGESVASRIPEIDAPRPYGLTKRAAASLVAEYRANGHAYSNYPNAGAYGISLTSPEWIRATAQREMLREVYFKPRGWYFHQDVFGFVPIEPERQRFR